MDKAVFFNVVRHAPFPNKLAQSQVDGMNAILDEWEKRGLDDKRWLAYILATTYHETAFTMQPIEEIGRGAGRAYGHTHFYGRGFVQLTWEKNYQTMSNRLQVDLVSHPEKALNLKIATQILFEGMIDGLFTGKSLRHYFGEDSDWYNARKVINGLDCAEKIAKYARAFFFAIDMASQESQQSSRSVQEIIELVMKIIPRTNKY